MKILNHYISFLLLLSGFIYSGCDDTGTEPLPEIPESNVSFSAHIQPIFNRHCLGCHDNSQRAGGLSLETWNSTTADPGVVFPGDPDVSRLVWSIEGRPGANPMPPLGSQYLPLTVEQVNGIKKWIEEGAKPN